jgi:hypothetical protein
MAGLDNHPFCHSFPLSSVFLLLGCCYMT